ncbi:MAG TPA: tetratricopeptide repeat protein, partial [Vicinamibacteria bacterium]|nr:tetratricopeptide repeat protein [Vicinamibacteria bacterium]
VLLAVVFTLAALDVHAQRGSIRGKLIDEQGNPIQGATCTIELSGGGGRTTSVDTKEDGQFVKGGILSGTYTITCEKEGYRRLALSTNVSGFDQANLGERVLYQLAPGELSEAEHARATELLEKFNLSSEAGNDQATLDSLMQLKEMMPESAEVHFNIASTYEKMDDQDKALEYYTKTTELKPDFYEAWLAVGDIYGKRNQWAEAQSAMKKAIDLQATDAVAIFNYAVYAQNAGDTAAAKAGYEKVLELDPKRALAHYQLGLIAVNETDNETAIAHFEKFLELEPSHPQADAAKGVIAALKQAGSQ